jgi:E3 ubiquitin-protein ligase CHFR
MIDVLLRTDPSRARTDREKQQADDIYKPGLTFRVRIQSLSPHLPHSLPSRYASRYQLRAKHLQSQRFLKVASLPVPARTAYQVIVTGGNAQTQCPTRRRIQSTHGLWTMVRLPDMLAVETGLPSFSYVVCWLAEPGFPPSENFLAIDAPTTTKCDMCQVFFCGIGVQHRCVAVRLANAHPHGMSDISDLIQSTEVYECFDGNAVEVEIMLDYLSTQNISPRQIYCEASLPPFCT